MMSRPAARKAAPKGEYIETVCTYHMQTPLCFSYYLMLISSLSNFF
jgi:hypothetical protein